MGLMWQELLLASRRGGTAEDEGEEVEDLASEYAHLNRMKDMNVRKGRQPSLSGSLFPHACIYCADAVIHQ